MRRGWWVAGIVVLCLPLVFASWLMLAARWSRMDAMTMHMPMAVRSVVAEVALTKVGWDKGARSDLARVTRLDPQNGNAWRRLCRFYIGSGNAQSDVQVCRTALSFEDSAVNWDGLGEAQEKAGNDCAAADSFTKAASKMSDGGYGFAEEMGRASLRCGKLYDARAGLEAAIDIQTKNLKTPDPDADDEDSTQLDQATDREYLIVTYDRLKQKDLAAQTCSAAHPQWKGCSCHLDEKKEVACEERKR